MSFLFIFEKVLHQIVLNRTIFFSMCMGVFTFTVVVCFGVRCFLCFILWLSFLVVEDMNVSTISNNVFELGVNHKTTCELAVFFKNPVDVLVQRSRFHHFFIS